MGKNNVTAKIIGGLFLFFVGLAVLQTQSVSFSSIDSALVSVLGIGFVVVGIGIVVSIFVD